MKAGIFSVILLGLAFTAEAYSQEAAQTPAPAAPAAQLPGVGPDGWQGLRNGAGMGAGRGIQGTVTAVAADHYTVKTDAGDVYKVNIGANTRIARQQMPRNLPGQAPSPDTDRRVPPQPLKASDIKVGDPVAAIGPVDYTGKTMGALMVLLINPERAKMMREMQENYGKTWLAGKVTAIDGVKITVQGSVDNAPHSFTADENTTFRKRREPITLADVQVGDMMRVDGVMKDGAFVASTISVMGMPRRATVPQAADTPSPTPQTTPPPSPPETQPR